jgi:penicillin-binding protein 2
LAAVVTEGTGGRAKSSLVTIGGKTGTAQTAALRTGPEKDIPKKFRDHAWFVAFAPVENPKIAVAVLAEHMGHGGSAAAPLAKELIETYIKVTAAKPLTSSGPPTPAQVAKAGAP